MYFIASFQYSVRGGLGLIVRIHDETNGILFHDFFDSIRWRYALETAAGSLGLVMSGAFSFFVTLVSIVLGGTESLVRNSTRYRVVILWQNMEHGTYLGTMQPGRRYCYPGHEVWCMRMNRTWHIMGVKFLGCDSHRVVALVSFVFGGFHRDSIWGG